MNEERTPARPRLLVMDVDSTLITGGFAEVATPLAERLGIPFVRGLRARWQTPSRSEPGIGLTNRR